LADVVYLFDKPSRKRRMARDIGDAFPEFTRSQISKIVLDCYRSVSESLIDSRNFMRFARPDTIRDLVEIEGKELLDGLGRKGGIVFATGHFGCWEMLGAASALIGYPAANIARPRNNPVLNKYIRKLREASGQRILEKKGSMREAINGLRNGLNVGFLIDQDARRHGIFLDFFGKPASTLTGVVRIAIYTGAPMVFIYSRRIPGQNRFRVVFQDVIQPRHDVGTREEVFRIAQRFTKDLEDVVRQWPSEWLWLHSRWKSYPGKYPGQASSEWNSSALAC
jgi:KDO2-lipid IV(A) lauroyltransferase